MSFFSAFEKTAGELFKMRATPAKHGGKDGRKMYTLEQDGEKWTCTCPDYQYRRAAKGEQCKHIRAKIAGKKPWELKKSAALTWNMIRGNAPAKVDYDSFRRGLNFTAKPAELRLDQTAKRLKEIQSMQLKPPGGAKKPTAKKKA